METQGILEITSSQQHRSNTTTWNPTATAAAAAGQQEAAAAAGQQEAAAAIAADWINNREILLVVVTLITTLTYPMVMNPPGGCWQDDKEDPNGHVAGQPILRDKHPTRYMTLMIVNWLSFYNSLILTVWLLSGVPANSKRVRYSFLFSYTCLVLTYNVSQEGYSLLVAFLVWIMFAGFVGSLVIFQDWICCRK